MGMFDTVNFSCPNCGSEVRVQTKAGQCELAQYGDRAVPVGIADALHGHEVTCDDCGAHLVLQAVALPLAVPMYARLAEKGDV